MKIYLFSQNNSGGYFLPPAAHVFIAAESAEEANEKALTAGVYFGGVSKGRDCECCGSRWWGVDDDDAMTVEAGLAAVAAKLADTLKLHRRQGRSDGDVEDVLCIGFQPAG